MKKSISSISNSGSRNTHSKMRKTVAPIAAGVIFTMLACQTPKEKQADSKPVDSGKIITPREYESYLDVDGNPLILKSILSVNTDLQFYEDSISKDLALYKNRSVSNGEYRKEIIKGGYLRVEDIGDFVKAFKDTTVFDLISKQGGDILGDINDVQNFDGFNDEGAKKYKAVKKGSGYGLYKKASKNEDGSREEGDSLTPTKYEEIRNNGSDNKVHFIGHKDKGYDLLDQEGKLLSSVDRVVDGNVFIKDAKLLLFAQDGSKVQLDAYTVFDNGGEGSDGDMAIIYQGKRYYFNFMSSNPNHIAKYKNIRDQMNENKIGENLKVLIANRNLATTGKGEFDVPASPSGYEAVDARLLKPNKSEKELNLILSKMLPSKASQKRGEFAFEKVATDGSYILSYKIVGWSGAEKKQVLQSGADIKDYFLNNLYTYPLDELCRTIFHPIDDGNGIPIEENFVIDENGDPINDERMYKPDERVFIKFKPVTN